MSILNGAISARHREMIEVIEAALGYIDALPENVIAQLPAMPGFSRDWADNVLARAKDNTCP